MNYGGSLRFEGKGVDEKGTVDRLRDMYDWFVQNKK